MAKNIKIDKKKALETVEKAAKYTEKNYKTLLISGSVLVGLYLLIKLARSAASLLPDIGDSPTGGGGNPTTNGNYIPNGATISHNDAQIIASILFQAMDQFGTDETKIFNALENKNTVDYSIISEAFGTPRYGGFTTVAFIFPERNLTYWLSSELSNRDFKKIENIIFSN